MFLGLDGLAWPCLALLGLVWPCPTSLGLACLRATTLGPAFLVVRSGLACLRVWLPDLVWLFFAFLGLAFASCFLAWSYSALLGFPSRSSAVVVVCVNIVIVAVVAAVIAVGLLLDVALLCI